jgi:hypothetical protein
VRTFRNKNSRHFYPAVRLATALAVGLGFAVPAYAGGSFMPGNLVVSRSVYDYNPNNIAVGTVLPPGCAKTSVGCGHPPPTATNDGTYPEVFNNAIVDGSLGSRPKYISTTTRIAGTIPRAAILNNNVGYNSYYTAGNAGNGDTPQPNGIILGAGAQYPRWRPPTRHLDLFTGRRLRYWHRSPHHDPIQPDTSQTRAEQYRGLMAEGFTALKVPAGPVS